MNNLFRIFKTVNEYIYRLMQTFQVIIQKQPAY